MRVESDGSITVISGAIPMGQGVDTVLAQIVADALGVSVGRLTLRFGDTAIGTPPAIVNSAIDALSPLEIRHLDPPLHAEKIWRLLRSQDSRARKFEYIPTSRLTDLSS